MREPLETVAEFGDVWRLADDGVVRDENSLTVRPCEVVKLVRDLQRLVLRLRKELGIAYSGD